MAFIQLITVDFVTWMSISDDCAGDATIFHMETNKE